MAGANLGIVAQNANGSIRHSVPQLSLVSGKYGTDRG